VPPSAKHEIQKIVVQDPVIIFKATLSSDLPISRSPKKKASDLPGWPNNNDSCPNGIIFHQPSDLPEIRGPIFPLLKTATEIGGDVRSRALGMVSHQPLTWRIIPVDGSVVNNFPW